MTPNSSDPHRPVTKAEFDRLEGKVDEMSTSTKELVEAWKTAGGVVKFVKWLSTLVAAIGSLWLVFRFGFGKH